MLLVSYVCDAWLLAMQKWYLLFVAVRPGAIDVSVPRLQDPKTIPHPWFSQRQWHHPKNSEKELGRAAGWGWPEEIKAREVGASARRGCAKPWRRRRRSPRPRPAWTARCRTPPRGSPRRCWARSASPSPPPHTHTRTVSDWLTHNTVPASSQLESTYLCRAAPGHAMPARGNGFCFRPAGRPGFGSGWAPWQRAGEPVRLSLSVNFSHHYSDQWTVWISYTKGNLEL